ncbi:MAG: FCD domain-containing protein [Planctomycetaceae bacterium]|nr:FCD domain-containing protein [Planctomycetaceae bacterium]
MHGISKGTDNPLLPGDDAGKSVVDGVIAALCRDVVAGRIRPGQQIPTEPELVESLGVGRNSLREAIRILVAMGVLEIHRAEGTFVTRGFSPRMLDPALYGVLFAGGEMETLVDLRRIIEVGAFRLAVERRSDQEAVELTKAMDRLADAVARRDVGGILETDMAFHRLIERLSGNPLVGRICRTLEHLTMAARRRAIVGSLDADGGAGLLARHHALYRVVAERDSAAACFMGDELFDALLRY